MTETDSDKLLVLADPHEPYGNERVFEICETNEKHCGSVVVPGDVGDYYSKSRFRKTRNQSFQDEVRAVFRRLEWLATHWKKVYVMIGNHDNRPEKLIADSTPVDLLILTERNLLGRLVSYFDNIELVGTQLDHTDINLTHIWQYRDVIFTHGELSRAQKTAALIYVSTYLRNWKTYMGLKPYRVIAQAHNHQSMKTMEGDEVHIMLPTASDPLSIGMEYIYSSRMIGKPPAIGYSRFVFSGDELDVNQTHNVLINNARPIIP